MNTKLTLSIEDAVIRRAKAFARCRRKSLSKIVEQYLRFVTGDTQVHQPISDRINTIADTLQIDPGMSYDDLKRQYLREKHLGAKDSH